MTASYDIAEVERKCREAIEKAETAGIGVRPESLNGFLLSSDKHCCLLGAVNGFEFNPEINYIDDAAVRLGIANGQAKALERGFMYPNPWDYAGDSDLRAFCSLGQRLRAEQLAKGGGR